MLGQSKYEIDELKKIDGYKNENPEKAAKAYYNLADRYWGLNRKNALKYYKDAIKYTKNPKTKFKAYENIYLHHQDDTLNENKINYLKQTIFWADSAGKHVSIRFNYKIVLCDIYLQQKNYDKVIEIAQQALALRYKRDTVDSKIALELLISAYNENGNNLKYKEYSTMYMMDSIKNITNKYKEIKENDPDLNTFYEDFIAFKEAYKKDLKRSTIIEIDYSITTIILNIFESANKFKSEKVLLDEDIKNKTAEIKRKEKRIKYLDLIKYLFGGFAILIFILLTFALWGYFVKKKQHTLLNQQKYKIELQASELNKKNKELTTAFDHLKNTQDQLVQTEKMASLGQLIAGIAHELNTPLGAIKSSIGTVLESSSNAILMIPELVKTLNEKEFKLFTDLMAEGMQNTRHFTSREERAIKKRLRVQLENFKVEKHRSIADSLTDIGIHEIEAKFLPLFNSKHVDMILKTAYYLIIQNKNGQNIKIAVDRASKIIFALKSYSYTTQNEEMVMSNVANNIETVLTIYHNQLKQGIIVERKFEDLPEIKCFPDELSQVWTNIIHNAIQAMDSKGKLSITAKKEKNAILISFTDTGKGIPKDIQDKIFVPFYTTKAEGEGTGLGLDIIRKIVEKHKGTITFKSKEGVGTTFYVNLPIS